MSREISEEEKDQMSNAKLLRWYHILDQVNKEMAEASHDPDFIDPFLNNIYSDIGYKLEELIGEINEHIDSAVIGRAVTRIYQDKLEELEARIERLENAIQQK